jgi:hypothetical protein
MKTKALARHRHETPTRPFFPASRTSTNQRPFFTRPSLALQPKLTVGPANDKYENEADRVADQVVNSTNQNLSNPTTTSATIPIQRMCADCEEENNVQRKEASIGSEVQRQPFDLHEAEAGTDVDAVTRSAGRELDPSTRSFMESRFKRDFSQVKVHTNSQAAASAKAINAKAYTSGNNIVFAEGQYQPRNQSGRHLLAHELTHTIQQGNQSNASSIQRSCFDGHCEDCAGGWKTLWMTMFFARRANRATMDTLRRRINAAKRILEQCCIRLKFDFNWTLIPNAATVDSASRHRRPAGDANGQFDVPEPLESVGEGQLIANSRGIPLLVVDEIRGGGGGLTILGGRDDRGNDYDLQYTGPSMMIMAVNQPREGLCSQRDSTIAHELWHITGALRHSAAEAGGIADCSSDNVNQTYCNAVRALT